MGINLEQLQFILDATNRRCWLLSKALECAPLDQAVELARRADDFVIGSGIDPRVDTAKSAREPVATSSRQETIATPQDNAKAPKTSTQAPEAADKLLRHSHKPAGQTRLGLSPEQRDQLIERLPTGATNAELADAFGLSPRQVQGVRMALGRKASKGRARDAEDRRIFEAAPTLPTSLEEVIRYLRQQDDVVVPQGPDAFLVNGRFRMNASELLAKANRMRSRQGRPEFTSSNGHAAHGRHTVTANGHPLFWNGSASSPSRLKANNLAGGV